MVKDPNDPNAWLRLSFDVYSHELARFLDRCEEFRITPERLLRQYLREFLALPDCAVRKLKARLNPE